MSVIERGAAQPSDPVASLLVNVAGLLDLFRKSGN